MEEILTLQKRIGTENKYEDLHEMTNPEKIAKAKEVLQNMNYENIIVVHMKLPHKEIYLQSLIQKTKANLNRSNETTTDGGLSQ